MALVDTYDNRPATFLRIDGDGRLFISSKEQQEGYEEFVSKQGNKSYRRYYSGVIGKVRNISEKEVEYDTGKVKVLFISITDGDEDYIITFQVLTQKGGLNTYARSLACYGPNLDFSRRMRIAPARKQPGEDYAPGNLFFTYVDDNNEKIEAVKQYYKKGEHGLPDGKQIRKITGETTWDFTEQDTFLYGKLNELLEKFKREKEERKAKYQAAKDTAAEASRKSEEKLPPEKESPQNFAPDDDSLPF